jgi:hypothetical protein
MNEKLNELELLLNKCTADMKVILERIEQLKQEDLSELTLKEIDDFDFNEGRAP